MVTDEITKIGLKYLQTSGKEYCKQGHNSFEYNLI
jgi:hypothetical protein